MSAKRNFFYGINFELGYELPRFSPTPWNLEIRPIVGVRNAQWEFIAYPIVDIGFGQNGEIDFAPALRLARNLGEDRFIGLDFTPISAVTDFKVKTVGVELGVGYGFTPGSDRLMVKAIIGYAFPVPGKSSEGDSAPTSLAMGTPARPAPLLTK